MDRRSAGTREPADRADSGPQGARTTPRGRTHRRGFNSDSGRRRGLGARELQRKEPRPRPRPAPPLTPPAPGRRGARGGGALRPRTGRTRRTRVQGPVGPSHRCPWVPAPPGAAGYPRGPQTPARAPGAWIPFSPQPVRARGHFSSFYKKRALRLQESARPSHQAGGGAAQEGWAPGSETLQRKLEPKTEPGLRLHSQALLQPRPPLLPLPERDYPTRHA